MNQINGKAWVDALRSGKYVQGKFALRQTTGPDCINTYCCLGVVTELAVAAGVLPAGILSEVVQEGLTFQYQFDKTGKYTNGSLPESVREWLEIKNPGLPLQLSGRGSEDASYVNDKLKYTFAQIADLIESQYLTPQSINSDESN